MKSTSKDSTSKIKHYALKLINIRDRSEKELFQRLKSKCYQEKLINETIEHLKSISLINDNKLAQSIVNYCEHSKILGIFGCKQYLKKRGIPKDIINDLTFSYEKEIEKAKRLLTKKKGYFEKYPPSVSFNKLYGLLQRRGFEREIIIKAIIEFK